MTTRDELSAAILASQAAGWCLPVKMVDRYGKFWVYEADDTPVAEVATSQDARVIVAALNWVLTMPVFEPDGVVE